MNTFDDNNEILLRLNKLEKKNKQLRFFNFAILFIFIAGALIGWQSTSQFFKEIETEKLVIKDKDGKERAVLLIDTATNSPKLRFKDQLNNIITSVGINGKEGYITIADDKDSNNHLYSTRIESNGFFLRNNDILVAQIVTDDDFNTALRIADNKGNFRAVVYANSDTTTASIGLISKSGTITSILNDHRLEFYSDTSLTLELFSRGAFSALYFYNPDIKNHRNVSLESNLIFNRLIIEDPETGEPIAFLGEDLMNNRIRGIEIYDTLGKRQIIAGTNEEGSFSGLAFYNNEKITCNIISQETGTTLNFFYLEKCKSNFGITNEGNPYLNFFDNSQNSRINMFLQDYGKPSISLHDGNGNMRTNIGCTSIKYNNGTTSNKPESSIYLFNESGNVIYQAPQ